MVLKQETFDNMNKNKSYKIYPGASFPTKVVIVITLGFFTKLFFSCTPPPPIEMHFNSINIVGVDNSDRYLSRFSSVDSMFADAVALKLTLSDSTFDYYASNFNKVLKSISFTPAMALSIEESFIPVNKVQQIKITTLFDINENVRAGDDISNLIVYETGSNFELYQNMNRAISILNKTQISPSSSVILILKTSVNNTKAQFNVRVLLDNGNELSYNTPIYTIIIQ